MVRTAFLISPIFLMPEMQAIFFPPLNFYQLPKLLEPSDIDILLPFFPRHQKKAWSSTWQANLASQEATYLRQWRRLRLTPLLFHELTRHGWQEVFSPWLVKELQIDYARSLRTASWQEEEIANTLLRFQQEGIEVILLKGADLRHRLYADPASRPMVDVDFLISSRMFPRARQVLHSLGYRLDSTLLGSSVGLKRKFGNEFCFHPPPRKNLFIDLHWEIEGVARLYRISYENASAQTTSYHGIMVKVLAPEHLLIHLCLHLLNNPRFKPGDPPLAIQIIDLVWALDRLPINWTRFLEEVCRLRSVLAVYRSLQGLSGFLPELVPAEVMSSLTKLRPFWYEVPLLRLWHEWGNLHHHFPRLKDYLPRISPLRRIWVR